MMQILIIVCLAAIYTAVRKVFKQQKHLTEQDFNGLMTNKLNGDNYHRVVGHLGICEECQKALEEYNNMD